MSLLSLNLPNWNPNDSGQATIPRTDQIQYGPNQLFPSNNLGGFLSGAFSLIFYAAGMVMFLWFIWGVFRYILAEGKKEELAKAKNHMRWAIVGFLLFIAAFFFGPFTRAIIPQVDEFYKDKFIPQHLDEVRPDAALRQQRKGEQRGN